MRSVFLFFMIFSMQSFAVGSPARLPLITKTSQSGFVPTGMRRIETCEVYEDHVRIQKHFGEEVVLEQEVPVTIQGLPVTVEKAQKEPLTEKPSGICDAPETEISARTLEGDEVPLFSTGGCGGPSRIRNGEASQTLRDLVGVYCPLTYENDDL